MVGTNERGFVGGRLVVTPGIQEKMEEDPEFREAVHKSIQRHLKCDWGDMSNEDKSENDFAVKKGDLRIFSAYELNPKIWIITEADRSATTVLFPEEY